ncbi:MAG: HAD-IA family hydrolase [Candidatus Dormibacteraeota bacterium]|nr:HAD-IA family hydrolase [Candidatus Dormibacteraeota bacterium]
MGFRGAIFDVDGVLVDSPHERAWRESLQELMENDWRDVAGQTTYRPELFTTAVYQAVMAGKPRASGARSALEYFHVPDAEGRAARYGERKQQRVVELIEAGQFHAFPDALRFVLALKGTGLPLAVASSSKNAELFLTRIRLDVFAAERGLPYGFVGEGLTLQQIFDADLSGRDFEHGKPDPTIFLTAAAELSLAPETCFVVEDASAGVQAARAGAMGALGVARLQDQALLAEAGAHLVVTSLDEVAVDALSRSRLERGSMS